MRRDCALGIRPMRLQETRAVLKWSGARLRTAFIAKIAIAMAEVNINIVDVNQKIMEEIFVMTMACDIAGSAIGMKELRSRLDAIAKEMPLEITVQNEAIFKAMHRI